MNAVDGFPGIDVAALGTWRRSGRFNAFGAHRVFAQVDDAGDERPWLLLLHGFPTASIDWLPLWPSLTRDFRVLAPDLLGFGFSDKPARHRYTIAEQADLVEHWCRALGITRCHVVAHDYGVTVAQELLARDQDRPDGAARIASIVFLNGGLFPETHRPRLIQRLLLTPLGPLLSRLLNERSFARSFSAVFGAKTQPSSAELAAFWQLIREQAGQRIAHRLMRYVPERRRFRERWVGALLGRAVPKRLINGAADPVSGAHMAARYRELIAQADVVWLDDIGHYPQVEAPERVLPTMRTFWIRLGAISPTA